MIENNVDGYISYELQKNGKRSASWRMVSNKWVFSRMKELRERTVVFIETIASRCSCYLLPSTGPKC